jgi:type II secretory pathway component GspD/PulD (secretin)
VVGADHPIKYSIVDYGVVFSPQRQLSTALLSRTFKIDPNTFFAGLRRETQFTGTDTREGVEAFKKLISDAGVDLQVLHKSVFYNDRLGLIFVRATEKDLDAIESVLAKLNTLRPQIHIKARFMEVPKEGFTFPLADTNGPAGQATGILNAEQTPKVIRMLETKPGFETLGQPEVVTSNGRRVQMRTTQVLNIVTNFTSRETATNVAIIPQTETLETGPVLDIVATALPDGYTIDLKTTASVTEFMGYDQPTNSIPAVTRTGEKFSLPTVLPRLRVRQTSTHLRLWDGQTIVLGNLPAKSTVNGKEVSNNPNEQEKSVVVFITATLVDPAGNRVHTDDEMPFTRTGVPPQEH